MKLRVIVVGRDRADPLCAVAEDYFTRLRRSYPVELIEVREEPLTRSVPPERVKALEAERIRKVLRPGDFWIALDERGREWSSLELADAFRRWRDGGRASIAFVIGGPLGLDPELVLDAAHVWSLSRLTLAHRVARVVVAEQLYRAVTILRGEPYHK